MKNTAPGFFSGLTEILDTIVPGNDDDEDTDQKRDEEF